MSLTSAQTSTTKAKPAPRQGMRGRFAAWWHGYYLKELKDASTGGGEADDGPNDGPIDIDRTELIQHIWGEGFRGPGGPKAVLNLVHPCYLQPDMSVLELGAGLGGGIRTLAAEKAVQIVGMDHDPEIVAAGMALSKAAGMETTAPLAHYDPSKFEMAERSLDMVFSKNYLFTVEDKSHVFRVIGEALKENGQLVFTDYVLADKAGDSRAVDNWRNNEPVTPFPCSAAEYRKNIIEEKMEIREAVDVTDEICSSIRRGWADFLARAEEALGKAPMPPMIVEEFEIWNRRVQAMEGGGLRVYRFHALKTRRTELMSDW